MIEYKACLSVTVEGMAFPLAFDRLHVLATLAATRRLLMKVLEPLGLDDANSGTDGSSIDVGWYFPTVAEARTMLARAVEAFQAAGWQVIQAKVKRFEPKDDDVIITDVPDDA